MAVLKKRMCFKVNRLTALNIQKYLREMAPMHHIWLTWIDNKNASVMYA